MHKVDKKISQHKIKRYQKNLLRQQRRMQELENHVNWLWNIVKAGVEIDMDKIIYKKIDDSTTMRNYKEVKLIIDKLVSRGARIKQ